MFDARTFTARPRSGSCGCLNPTTYALLGGTSLLGDSAGAFQFALSQDAAIVADLAASNPMKAVRDALATPWNPNPTDAQAQAALADPQNAKNVLLIIQRAGATPEQLKSIPQPGQVDYLSPAVTAALQKIQGNAPPAPAPPPPPTPAPAPAPAPPPPPPPSRPTSPSPTTTSDDTTTSNGVSSDTINKILLALGNGGPASTPASGVGTSSSPAGSGSPAKPPAGFAYGPDGVTLVPLAKDGSKPAGSKPLAPLSTGPFDFLAAPMTLPLVGDVPAGLVYSGAALLGWVLLRGRSHG